MTGFASGRLRGWRLALFALAVASAASALSPRRAQAQSDDGNAQYWLHERALEQRERAQGQHQRTVLYQRPTHLIRREKPVRGFTVSKPMQPAAQPENPAAPNSEEPAAETAPGSAPAVAATLTPPRKAQTPPNAAGARNAALSPIAPSRVFTVAVLGDSLAQFLEEGLIDAYSDRPDVVVLKRAKESTGLVREDFFDWVKASRDLASGKDHIDLAVIMIGSNDRQPIRDRTNVYEPLTPEWKKLYGERVKAIIDAFRERKIPVIWVGAPIMKSGVLSDAMLAMNDIDKQEADENDATYLDVWDLFADDSGQYAAYGPDVDGDTAKLRSADGVHFTRAGALKLAQFVEPDIKRLMQGAEPKADQAIAGVAPQIAPAEPLARQQSNVPRPARASGGASNGLLVPIPAEPIRPVIPVRPASGRVVALTTPVVAPDAKLVTRKLVQSSVEGEDTAKQLEGGAPIQPRPGRADDFQWPHD